MPAYPTRPKKAVPVGKPRPQPGRPRKDNRKTRRSRTSPYRPVPPEKRPPLPGKPRAPAPGTGGRRQFGRKKFKLGIPKRPISPWDVGDFFYRRYFEPYPTEPRPDDAILADYYVKHGPNKYPHPYDDNPPSRWATSYSPNGAKLGPQTAVISGQARSYQWADFADAVPYPRIGWWIKSETSGAYASYVSLHRVQNNPALASKSYPMKALWDGIVLPSPAPLRGPEPQPPPYRRPLPQQQPGPKPPPTRAPSFANPMPGFSYGQPPATATLPGTRPLPWPLAPNAGSVTQALGQPPRSGPVAHNPKPPRSGEKEKKGALARFAWALMNYFGTFTEGLDLIDSANKALPPQYRARSFYQGKPIKPSAKKQAEAVWKYADKIDMNEFAKNVFLNHIEDEVLGRLGKAASKVLGEQDDGIFLSRLTRING